ncbi:MAG: hypothetical protein HKN71_09385 [Gemmatimonadetes bacterium]|nr:hypothetical protein [Gemmatimonadota bacterium]
MSLTFLFVLLVQAPAANDTVVLATALGHAGGVVGVGRIQVSAEVGEDFWGVDERPALLDEVGLLAAAAVRADMAFGPDEAAIVCPPEGGCRAVGAFRGLVHVWDFQRLSEDDAVVRLRILVFSARREWIFERIDDVFVGRGGSDDQWQIIRVEQVSIS